MKHYKVALSALLIVLILLLSSCSKTEDRINVKSPTAPNAPALPVIPESQLILDKMTEDEKLGQLVVVGFPKEAPAEQVMEYIREHKVSGFILFKRNYDSFEELYSLCQKLKGWNTSNPLPLFLSVDEEGGTVSRLPSGGTKFPDAQLIGRTNSPELNYEAGKTIGKELKAAGININYAPVLDTLSNKNSKLLIKRAYSSNPTVVGNFGLQFILGLQSQGVIAVPKHFPGHGATSVDSHGKLPVIEIDKATLISRELVPFKKCMKETDAIMVGHLAFPRIDTTGVPATMSKVFLKDILRDELDFKGIAITDDIEMYGFMNSSKTLEDSVIKAFNAGVDIFLISYTKDIQDRVFSALKDGVQKGTISKERLDESVRRIIEVKLKYKLSNNMDYNLSEAKEIFGSKENKAVLENINKHIHGK